MTPAEHLARRFHETYERLAPLYGYTTREETRTFDPTTPNGKLMIAVCADITDDSTDTNAPAPAQPCPYAGWCDQEGYCANGCEIRERIEERTTDACGVAPSPASSLTDEDIAAIAERMEATDPGASFWREFARAVEAHVSGVSATAAARPVAWVRVQPDGTITEELLPDRAIEKVRKESGAWIPLYAPYGVSEVLRG